MMALRKFRIASVLGGRNPIISSINSVLHRNLSVEPSTRKRKVLSDNVKVFDFNSKGNDVLNEIQSALQPILIANTTYSLTRDTNEKNNERITLNTGSKGYYIFIIDSKVQNLIIQTPISGILQYSYDAEENLWLNVLDRHDMRGLVTRDLLRHSLGMAKF
jgi:hypothetical protein